MKMIQSKILHILIISLLIQATAFGATLYVRTDGYDANPGTSWPLAKRTVQAAINAANAGDEIWVAAGTYNEHIVNRQIGGVAVDVALFGGFAGTEFLRSQRSIGANLTVLHGTNNGVVVAIKYSAGRATRIDGFYITGGNTSGATGDTGGGVHIVSAAPTIANNTIKGNLSYGVGAGISVWYFQPLPSGGVEYPLIVNNKIVENFAYDSSGDGGGIGIVGSSPEIRNNVIARNQANQNGGGICMWEDSAPVIADNFILANASNILDGGSSMNYGGGGIFASSFYEDGTPCEECISAPQIFNNVIAANGGLKGGGLAITDSNSGVALITNNTIASNSGAGVNWANAAPDMRNNLVVYNTWGLEQWNVGANAPTLAYNNVFGNTLQGLPTDYEGIGSATGTSGNISADPKLANPSIGDYHIQPGSPCINAGSSAAVGVDWTDIDGQPRIAGPSVDIGADESDGTVWNAATPVIRVRSDGNDANDGSGWANAKKTLTAGIQAAAATGGEVWVKAGTYLERITVPAYVHLYGGFAGTETQRSGRSVSANPTIIDGDNVPPVVSFTQAGYLVSTLDGFIVQHGGFYTAGTDPSDLTKLKEGRGGGVFIRTSGPLLENNTIRWNSLGNPYATPTTFAEGAGVGCFIAFPKIAGNTISENEILFKTGGGGGGVYCKQSRPWITQNIIRANRAVYGAGIFCTESVPRISGNTIELNTMYDYYALYQGASWGAVALYICRDFVIDGNLISGNTAAVGAGIYLPTCFNGRILNNVLAGNRAEKPNTFIGQGAGIYCLVSQTPAGDHLEDVIILNNTIVGNIAIDMFSQGGWGGGMALDILEERLVIANNIIAFNSSGIWKQQVNPNVPELVRNDVYDNPQGPGTDYNYVNLAAGATDLSLDPLFLDQAGGDYRLQPGSPCIDNGDGTVADLPKFDIDGNPRPKDGDFNGIARIDIGAYEFSQCAGDFEGEDGDVDGSDLVQWRIDPKGVSLQAFASCFGRDDCQ